MTKAELLNAVSSRVPDLTKKQTADVVDAVFEALTDAILTSERFSYPGFGTFTVKERAARDGRNPRTNEPIKIKASKTVSFKPAPKLKDTVNGEPEKSENSEKEVKAPKKCGGNSSKKGK